MPPRQHAVPHHEEGHFEKVRSKSNCLACHPTMQKDGSTEANMKFLPANLKSQCGE